MAGLVPFGKLGVDTVYLAAPGDPVAVAEGFAIDIAPRLAEL